MSGTRDLAILRACLALSLQFLHIGGAKARLQKKVGAEEAEMRQMIVQIEKLLFCLFCTEDMKAQYAPRRALK